MAWKRCIRTRTCGYALFSARVTELRAQLGKMGGESGTSAAPSSETDASLYPAIRQLPLLGVTYADLYRQTKIQETVYELLTQQYELAKVQEAKEVPSVKVLDAAVVPTKKSFPPRMLSDGSGRGIHFACDVRLDSDSANLAGNRSTGSWKTICGGNCGNASRGCITAGSGGRCIFANDCASGKPR